MYQILQVREKFTSSSPSLAKSKTFTSNGTTFFCLCLLAEKMNETEKFWKTGSWVFGFLCYFSIVLVFLEWFFIFLVFETFCQEKMKESDFIILNLFLGLLVKIRKQVKLSYFLVIFA
jgi:hypothetical protein